MSEVKLEVKVNQSTRVSACYHLPRDFKGGATPVVLVGHGAGGHFDSPLIAGICRVLREGGYAALRFNFPYREQGRNRPDPQELLEETYLAAVQAVQEHPQYPPGPLILGGKSLGGRIASQVFIRAATGRGLVFWGYPLHPPGQPHKLRDAHLAEIHAPMLFIQGTKDPLCRLDLLQSVLERLPAPVTLVRVQDGDHSFRRPASQGFTEEQIIQEVSLAALKWLDQLNLK